MEGLPLMTLYEDAIPSRSNVKVESVKFDLFRDFSVAMATVKNIFTPYMLVTPYVISYHVMVNKHVLE